MLWITTTIDDPDPREDVNRSISYSQLGQIEFDPLTSGFALRSMDYPAFDPTGVTDGGVYTSYREMEERRQVPLDHDEVQVALAMFARSICDARRLTRMRFENIHFANIRGRWLEFWLKLAEVDYLRRRITELVFDSCTYLNQRVLGLIQLFSELECLSICNFVKEQGRTIPLENYLGEHAHLVGIEFTSRDISVSDETLKILKRRPGVKRLRVSMGTYPLTIHNITV